MAGWNHNQRSKSFGRRNCPICGASFNPPDRSGAFDDERHCIADKSHYSNFYSLFADSVTILGKRFDSEDDVELIEEWLDQVGNPKYK